jgi:sulfite exporter TauE/SafE
LEISIPIAFVIGLFSATHCLGMCGSISGALSLSLPAAVRERPDRLTFFLLAYNLGRLASYTGAGALVGLIGGEFIGIQYLREGRLVAQILASVVVIAVGLYLTGWFPQLRLMDRLGSPLWRRLEPLGRRLLPVQRLPQAVLFGIVWGWLPCGLVYYVLLLTLSTGSAATGALCMLSFGIGTLPAMLGVGLAAGWFSRLAANPTLRQVAGLALVVTGCVGVWLSGYGV